MSTHHKDNVNESSSSDKLLQATQHPSSDSDYKNSTMASNVAGGSKDSLIQQTAQGAPKSLDLEENHRKPTYNSLKNWVRLASFEKADLSPASNSISSNVSKTPSIDVSSKRADMEDKDSRISVGSTDSTTKKAPLWKNDKNMLKLPGIQNDRASLGRSSGRASDITPGQKFLSAAMAIHATVRLSRMERAKRRAKWAGKKLLVFMLSHIGLIFLMLSYATAGGFLFRWLERDATITKETVAVTPEVTPDKAAFIGKTEPLKIPPYIEQLREKYIKLMWNKTMNLNVFHPVTWSQSMGTFLKEFETKVYEAAFEAASNQTNDKVDVFGGAAAALKKAEVEEEWTIPASLLFSTTVITSIGYGDITPKTTAGKLVCIPFAIVGIPLTLICLANIGQLMAGCCRFAWRRLTQCGRLCRKTEDIPKVKDSHGKTRVPVTVSLCIMLGYTLLGALIFSSWEEDWSFIDGFYFSFITLSTIGFGDLVPGQYEKSSNERRVVCVLYLLMGLAMLSMVFQLMIDSVMEVVEKAAKIFGLSNEQIKEEIEGIDESTVPTPNLIPPEPPKAKARQHNHKHKSKIDKSVSTSPQSIRKRKDVSDSDSRLAEKMV